MVSLGLFIDWATNKYMSWQENGSEFNQNTILQYSKEKLQLVMQKKYLLYKINVIIIHFNINNIIYIYIQIVFYIFREPSYPIYW